MNQLMYFVFKGFNTDVEVLIAKTPVVIWLKSPFESDEMFAGIQI